MTTPDSLAEDVEGTTLPSIWGQQQRLWRCDDGPEELATTMVASAEEDDPEDSTTTEASAEEAEDTPRLIERLRRRMRKCVYGPR